EQCGPGLRTVALRHAHSGYDAVEWRGQRVDGAASTLGLQRGQRGARIGHRFVRLDELILRRQLLREQLRGGRALLARRIQRLDRLE
ncbi:hypothetical protein, partial [Pseudomonas sp. GW531-E2]|uniref:hypothetical protein n=1 Tax=Pseudomonas sp. GW531-E2 TaxID=2070679 RepID=UPI001304F7CA